VKFGDPDVTLESLAGSSGTWLPTGDSAVGFQGVQQRAGQCAGDFEGSGIERGEGDLFVGRYVKRPVGGREHGGALAGESGNGADRQHHR
jgi:hypothetical protein